MKDILVPIDNAGRVVIPKKVRQELSILAGDMLKVSIEGSRVTLMPKKAKAGFVRKGRALVFSSGGRDVLTRDIVENHLSEDRDARTFEVVNAAKPRNRK